MRTASRPCRILFREAQRCSGIAGTVAAALLSCACSTPHAEAVKASPPDQASEAWYAVATKELAELTLQAQQQFKAGKMDAASASIEQGETISARLLSVPRPTLKATQSASDLDQLYGRMLFRNRHYGWARLQFQKNVARWKRLTPPTAASMERLAAAQAEIDRCDRAIEQQAQGR